MLEELDYDYKVHNANDDQGLAVKFYMSPLKDEEATLKEGRPIFKETEMVEIRVRGDRNNVVNRPVFDEDRKRFRAMYRDWKDGKSTAAVGTPLSEWPLVSASFVEEMKYFGFNTVEQLAAAGENVLSNFAGLRQMVEKAKAYIEFAKGSAPVVEQTQKILDLENALQAKDAQLADMARRMAAMEATMARISPDEAAPRAAAKRG